MHHETVAVLIGIKQMKHKMNMIVKKSWYDTQKRPVKRSLTRKSNKPKKLLAGRL